MNVYQAIDQVRAYWRTTNPSEDETFLYTEALNYLIREAKDPRAMMELGGYYYGQRRFDLALKYYEMAAAMDSTDAYVCLGYIWYYGRTGTIDYEKAFHYFEKAMDLGDVIAAYKVADMYRNGYYVEKDLERYRKIIETLYETLKHSSYYGDSVPEVYTRLARIRSDEGNVKEALRLYTKARKVLARRIQANPFWGNLNIMKWMIWDIYKLKDMDRSRIRLYDLYELLKTPVQVRFRFDGEQHEVETAETDGNLAIRFDKKWFRTVDDFFQKAELDGELLTACYDELTDFEVVDEGEGDGEGKETDL